MRLKGRLGGVENDLWLLFPTPWTPGKDCGLLGTTIGSLVLQGFGLLGLNWRYMNGSTLESQGRGETLPARPLPPSPFILCGFPSPPRISKDSQCLLALGGRGSSHKRTTVYSRCYLMHIISRRGSMWCHRNSGGTDYRGCLCRTLHLCLPLGL